MIRILATADWHLGNCFHGFDRQEEHADYLGWLLSTAIRMEVDALLVCGDVFDSSNPSAASQELYYSFLDRLSAARPALRTVIIAGNHDSAMRLEAPKLLLRRHNVRVIGVVPGGGDGVPVYGDMTVELHSSDGERAVVLAVPYLRDGDFPRGKGYAEGVAEFLRTAVSEAGKVRGDGALIVMTHLYAKGSEIAEDSSERIVVGGSEMVNVSCLNEDVTLLLSGHIHRNQTIGGRANWLYPVSALPMSFAERGYRHGAVYCEIDGGKLPGEPAFVEYRLQHPLLSVPDRPEPLGEVKKRLKKLPDRGSGEGEADEPYLEVKVLLDAPAAGLTKQIEDCLEGKRVRLCRTSVSYPLREERGESVQVTSVDDLRQLDPMEVIRARYRQSHGYDMSDGLVSLAEEAIEAARSDVS